MSGVATVGVVVPTFRRPNDLKRCLLALAEQHRAPDEVIVVVRDSDVETLDMLRAHDASSLAIRTVAVTVPGQVQALNAGLQSIKSDIMAITDDDAAPHADWLERIVAHLTARPDVAGIGGRDYLHVGGRLIEGRKKVVGIIPRFRSHVGHHHLGYGYPREVDVLKGVNGSYRVSAIRDVGFDERLRGTGAQVHWEISLGLALKRRRWKLLYDPLVAVDHFLAPRFDEDQRNSFNELALRNMAFNEALLRFEDVGTAERLLYFLWAAVIGTSVLPGFVQAVRFFPVLRMLALKRFIVCIQGRAQAWGAAGRSAV